MPRRPAAREEYHTEITHLSAFARSVQMDSRNPDEWKMLVHEKINELIVLLASPPAGR
jgi:hypothetical protein